MSNTLTEIEKSVIRNFQVIGDNDESYRTAGKTQANFKKEVRKRM